MSVAAQVFIAGFIIGLVLGIAFGQDIEQRRGGG